MEIRIGISLVKMSSKQDLRLLRKRVDLCQRENAYKAEVLRLQDSIMQAEQGSWKLKEELEKFRTERSFEWQLEKQDKVRSLAAQIVVDTEDLEMARDRYESVHQEIMTKYPELANDFLKQVEVDHEAIDADEMATVTSPGATVGEATSRISFGDSAQEAVYSWMIGKLTPDNKISNVLFGQFTRSRLPPSDGWVYVGRNLDRNVVAITKQEDQENKDMKSITSETTARSGSRQSTARSSKPASSSRNRSRPGSVSSDNASSRPSSVQTVADVVPQGATDTVEPAEIMAANDGSNSNDFRNLKILTDEIMESCRQDNLHVKLFTQTTNAPGSPDSPFLSPRKRSDIGDGIDEIDKTNFLSLEDSAIPTDDNHDSQVVGTMNETESNTNMNSQNISPLRSPDLMSPRSTGSVTELLARNDPNNFTYYVSGCSLDMLNGRYLPWGTMSNAPRYRNVRGWVVFRTALFEIPELGIYADGCYDATKGKSVTALLDARADIAYKELLDESMNEGIKEGSVQFKRRFSELSRSGSRTINTDQMLGKFSCFIIP